MWRPSASVLCLIAAIPGLRKPPVKPPLVSSALCPALLLPGGCPDGGFPHRQGALFLIGSGASFEIVDPGEELAGGSEGADPVPPVDSSMRVFVIRHGGLDES